jgi:shikimate kinase
LENRELLKRRGTVFYLYATPQQLLPRVGSTKKRPLLDVADPLERLDDLFTKRDKLYRETAHHVIVTRGKPPGQVVSSIRWYLKGHPETRERLCDRV